MNKLTDFIKKNKQLLICFGGIAAGIILMYGRAVGFRGNVGDDFLYLGIFNHGHSLSDLFVRLKTPILDLFSPLVVLSLYIDRLLVCNGNIIRATYCWNIFYFIVSAWGLYVFFRELRLPGKDGNMWQLSHFWAVAGVMLWALHPQRPESVVWLSERKDVLLACCTWWSWALFIRGYRQGVFSISALIFFLFSFGIKPMLLLFPGVLALWILVETKSKKWRDYRFVIPFAAVSVAAFILHIWHISQQPGTQEHFELAERLTITLWNCGNYAISAIFPLQVGPFHPSYPYPGWQNTILLCIILFYYILSFRLFPRHRSGALAGIGAAMIAFGLLLAPASGIVSIGNADWADRYNLLPSAMSVLVVTALLAAAWNAKSKYLRYSGGVVFSVIFIFYAGLCHFLVPIWRSDAVVVKAAMRWPVPNFRITFVSALGSIEAKDDKAFEKHKKQLLLEPKRKIKVNDDTIKIFLKTAEARMDFNKGFTDSALKKLESAVEDPSWDLIKFSTYGFPKTFLPEAAEVYLKRNQPQKAALMYEKLAWCFYKMPEGMMYRGIAYYYTKEYKRSISLLERAEKYLHKEKTLNKYLKFARAAALEEKKTASSPSLTEKTR